MIDFKNAEYLKLAPIKPEQGEAMVDGMLVHDERVVAAFKTIRDAVVFTNKRLIAINVQGVTGKKTDYTSLPFSKIQAFSVETAGHFDLDSELILWFSGLGQIKLEFSRNVDVKWISAFIGNVVL